MKIPTWLPFILFIIGLGIMIAWYVAAPFSLGVFVFVIIGAMALFIAIPLTAETRAFLGVPFLLLFLIIFSIEFPAVAGMAIFGAWWPTVEHHIDLVTEPLGAAWDTAKQTMEDMHLLITCPSCYYAEMERRRRLEVEPVSTIRAIEGKLELIGDAVQADPMEPLMGMVTLENQGEFTASNLEIKLNPLMWKNPETGEWDSVNDDVTMEFQSYPGGEKKTVISNRVVGCIWRQKIRPEEVRIASFLYKNIDKTFLYDCNCCCDGDCEDISCDPNEWKECIVERGKRCDPERYESATVIYDHGGEYIKFGMNYSFDYVVNSSLSLEVMNKSVFVRKLMAKEIRLAEGERKFSGGPLMVSIWSQRQPLSEEETIFGQLALTNKLDGIVKKATKIHLHLADLDGAFDNKIFEKISERGLDCQDFLTDKDKNEIISGYWTINCELDKNEGLKKDESAIFKFQFKYDLAPEIESRSTYFIATVSYTYEGEIAHELPIARFPG